MSTAAEDHEYVPVRADTSTTGSTRTHSDHNHHEPSNPGDQYDLELAKTITTTEALPFWRELVFVGIISAAQFCTQAGLTQSIALVNVIGGHFDLSSPGDLSWLPAAYSLTVGTFILMAGRMGDMFGYKRMLTIGYSWFSLWSLVAGLAYYSNHVLFDFARILQGIGPAILLPNGLAILGASYRPGKRKHIVFSIFGAMAPTGSIMGAIFAGIFNLTFWPWTFWAFAIALAGLAVGTLVFVHDPPRKLHSARRGIRQTLKEMDLLGATTGVIGLVLINFAWNQAGVVTWPAQPYLWVTLILGALFLAVFFYVEIKVSAFPLIPFHALHGDVAFVLACISCGWGCFGIWFYYLWLFLLNQHHVTPIQGAAWAVPLIPSGICAALTTGFLISRVRAGWLMLAAMTAFCVGTILIATAPPDQTYWAQVFVCTLVIAWGMDISFPAASVILSDAVEREHQGVGASLLNTVVNYSISLALGFAGTVEFYTNDGNQLKGYRSALYLAIGLSGLGMCLATVFLVKSYYLDRQNAKVRATQPAEEESAGTSKEART